ncbi:conserved hypothetical protein [Uncinocarpus reesii 1704]|uniref:Uncharacterized protein n=1 Tax=Uncinocarpus reesii (strain UAMH 1704) TaxID=336963 RepID=C4JJG3_UNCRE|nr:uncharacterized protein UREG_01770 [Uncinocarpus reesii 1704]EEP76921.1 conserved hypothetical protein [Uncinocarpus reesii 1704]
MHSPSTQLLRVMRASISSSGRAISRHAPFRQCPISQNATARFSRTITSTAATHSSKNNNGETKPFRLPPPPPYGRSEFTTADLKPKSRYRGPPPPEDPRTDTGTRTDLGALDVLSNVATPSTAIDACLKDGFHLNNGVKITGGSGCLLVDGEAFTWRPWDAAGYGAKAMMVNKHGQWEVPEEAWGVLSLVWPKPGKSNTVMSKCACG